MYEITKLVYRVSEADVIRARNQVATRFLNTRFMFSNHVCIIFVKVKLSCLFYPFLVIDHITMMFTATNFFHFLVVKIFSSPSLGWDKCCS